MFRFRTIYLQLAVVPAMALSSAVCFSNERPDTPIPETVREQMVKMYEAASECMKQCSPAYAAIPHTRPGLMMNYILPFDRPKAIEVDRTDDIYMQVGASSMRWESVVNSFVCWKYKPPSGWQKSPALTRDEAIQRAKEYLKIFKVDVPPDYKLEEPEFGNNGGGGKLGTSCWQVLWSRVNGQYSWDGSTLGMESVFVDFYEKEGLTNLADCRCNCPAPKSLEVKITKEEAIAKATQCVPLVQRNPSYRSSMRDGFVAKSVKSCELLVSAPNWWFDPKRCTFMSVGKAPTETRLCWKIKMATMDSKQEERRRKGELGPQDSLIAPQMTIYIDAATGEAVRADVM